MYSSLWSPDIRQGDIFGPINFPSWKDGIIWAVPGGLVVSATDNPTHGFVKATSRYAAVVSHDCEFNEGKRSHFLIARLEQLSRDPDIDELRRGNDIERTGASGQATALDTFVVEPIESCFDRCYRINFCTITPVAMDFRERVKELKRAEMLHSQRTLLRNKLAYFFGRAAEDIDEDQKKAPPPKKS